MTEADYDYIEPDGIVAGNAAFGNAHNIVANEETGFLYVVGSTQSGFPNTCSGKFMRCSMYMYVTGNKNRPSSYRFTQVKSNKSLDNSRLDFPDSS